MELLVVLPLLLGLALFGFFDGGGDGGSGNETDTVDENIDRNDQDVVAVGTVANETLAGSAEDDFILGAGGADSITGGVGYDVLVGEDGADTIVGDKGYDTLLGGSGNDEVSGGDGNDVMVGGSGSDYLMGGNDDDVLFGSSGQDKLQGDKGDDFIISAENLGSVSRILADYDAENYFTEQSAAMQEDLNRRHDGDAVFEAPRSPTLLDRVNTSLNSTGSGTADDLVFAGGGNDTIIADLSDSVTGGAGNDQINILSGGQGKSVEVRDFTPGQDIINVYVPTGTNPAISYVPGATPEDGVSVVVAGDVVAVLKGVVASNVPDGSIVVKVAAA